MEPCPESPPEGFGAPLRGICDRRRHRISGRLLDRPVALVVESMRHALAMVDPAHSPRHPAAHSPAVAARQVHADEAFNAVFDSSGEALVVIDSTGLIHRANRRARELLRFKDQASRHAGLGDFLSGPPADQLASFWTHRHRAARPPSLEAALASGFPIRITLRSILPKSQYLLLCMEESSLVQ